MRIHFERLAEEGPLMAAWEGVVMLTVDTGTETPLRIRAINQDGKASLLIERTTGERIALVPMGDVPAVD